jgi:hypothetical protein
MQSWRWNPGKGSKKKVMQAVYHQCYKSPIISNKAFTSSKKVSKRFIVGAVRRRLIAPIPQVAAGGRPGLGTQPQNKNPKSW